MRNFIVKYATKTGQVFHLWVSFTSVMLAAILNKKWWFERAAPHSPTVFAATNFMVGGNFTSSGCSGALASSGLVGLLLSWWGNGEEKKNKTRLASVSVRMVSRQIKAMQFIEMGDWSSARLWKLPEEEDNWCEWPHRCRSFSAPSPACGSYWGSSEWGRGGRWLCPEGWETRG